MSLPFRVPAHWKIVPFGDLVSHSAFGPRFSSDCYADNGNIATLRITDINGDGCISYPTMPLARLDEEKFGNHFLRANDLVIARTGVTCGTAAVFTRWQLPVLPGAFLIRFRLHSSGLPMYYRYLFNLPSGRDHLLSVSSGACQTNLNTTDTKRLLVPLPPITEQHAIVAVLEAYDALIENNTRRIKILEEMAQMIYREWLVKFRFPGHENVGKDESELGPIPKGWTVRNLFEVANVTYGFPFKSKLFTVGGEGIPVIRIRDIKADFSNTFSTDGADPKYVVTNGDLLVGMDGDFHMGKWAGGHAYLNQRVVRFRPKRNLSSYFLFLALEAPIHHFDSTIVGTTVAHLSDRDLRSTRILLPDDELLNKANLLFEPLFAMEIALKVKNANLRKTRDFLLPKLISGEIPVEATDDTTAELMEEIAQPA